MRNELYKSEEILQTIVANYPEVLAGSESGETARLALVKREKSVADSDTGAGRWSLDHLFLDQEGVPTLVEVKRSTDTRIRREVVGQMLDYAANGVKYWPVDDLREDFLLTHAEPGPEKVLTELIGERRDPHDFWRTVGDNLATGRIRMVFLADQIPPDLQRIIEFLNEQMSRAEVIGVEVKQYVGGGRQSLVPRRVGLTAQAQQAKGSGPKKRYAELMAEAPPELHELETRIRRWASEKDLAVGTNPASIGVYTAAGKNLMQFYPQPDWQCVELSLGPMRKVGLDDEADWVRDTCGRLVDKELPSISPSLPAAKLLPKWEEFESEILPKFLDYFSEAHVRPLPSLGPGRSSGR